MTRVSHLRLCLIVLIAAVLMAGWSAAAQVAPVFTATGPDAAAYGADAGYPPGPRGARPPQAQMVGRFTLFDALYAHATARRADVAAPFSYAAQPLRLSWTYQGQGHTLADYLDRHPVTGLVIARGTTILAEHYRYARNESDRFLSQSMAKTITALLAGIAVRDGAIRSIDDMAATYATGLSGTLYGQTSLRDLLHMASGIAFRETYDGNDDSARMGNALFGRTGPGPATVLGWFGPREVPPGTRFHYAGADTEALGLVIAASTGQSLTRLLERHVWQPMGAEADATWAIDTTGQETAFCCISATLRDWTRLGLMMAHDGAWNGRQIVPREWLMDATTVAAPFLAPGTATPGNGYGYQVWLLRGPRRQFVLLGIHGQAIFVDPAARLVMVHTAVRLKPSGDPAAVETYVMWRALVAAAGGG